VVTFRALTAHAEGSAKKLTRWAPALTDEALLTTRALVDGVRHEQPLALELYADDAQIRSSPPSTTPERELFAGCRATDGAAARERRAAQQAGASVVRRT